MEGDGSGGGDDSYIDRSGGRFFDNLPFKPDPGTLYADPGYEVKEGVFTVEQSNEAWQQMFDRWGARSDKTKTHLVREVLRYFIINSSSPRNEFQAQFIIDGKRYPVSVIHDILRRNVRRFARAQCEGARSYLLNNPTFAYERADILQLDDKWKEFAFDFWDGCKDIPQEARVALAEVKYWTLKGKTYRATAPEINDGTGSGARGSVSGRRSRSEDYYDEL